MGCEECDHCVQIQDCLPGYYGNSCNLTCSANCRIEPCISCACAVCNETSGSCLNGCNSGWYGELCEQSCPTNCSISHSVSTNCEQTSGTCLYGCVEGSFGEKCNETCGSKCDSSLCNQTTGDCINGCIRGFKGYLCQERSGEPEDDQLAGAVGGAFVIILWGVIVIIIICVIRRRRQKEYAAFKRNRSLNSGRGSSRRRLHRQTSVSSGSPARQPTDMDQCTYEIIIPDFELQRALYEARRQQYVRSYSDETPTMHSCAHHPEMEMRSPFRKKCHSLRTRREYENSDDDEKMSRDQSCDIYKATSSDEEEDPHELTEMWKIRKF